MASQIDCDVFSFPTSVPDCFVKTEKNSPVFPLGLVSPLVFYKVLTVQFGVFICCDTMLSVCMIASLVLQDQEGKVKAGCLFSFDSSSCPTQRWASGGGGYRGFRMYLAARG